MRTTISGPRERAGGHRSIRRPGIRTEVVLQADRYRQVAEALESLRGVEWGDAVRLHGRMAADEVPCRLVMKTDGVSPAPRHADRRVLGQCVVGAGEQLDAERLLMNRRIEGAEGARRGALGGGRPVRLKVDAQVLGVGFRMNWVA